MKAAVLCENKNIKIKNLEIPKLDENEILVKVEYSGVCGSDIPRVLNNGAHYYPIVLGHEFSGKIVEIGKNVKDKKIGDKISGIPLIPCMKCEECKKGNFSQCRNYKFVGSRIQGSWAEYVKIPSINGYVLPKEISSLEASFFEPLTVALHGLKLVNFCSGKKIAILGMGTIGLLALQAAKALGAIEVDAFDIDDKKLEIAKELGSNEVINTQRDKINLGHNDYDLVLETAGAKETFKLSLEIVKNNGEVLFIGTPHSSITFEIKEFELINRKELTIKGSWMNYSINFPGIEWKLAISLFLNNKIKVNLLIDRIIDLDELPKAFLEFENKLISGKVLLKFKGDE